MRFLATAMLGGAILTLATATASSAEPIGLVSRLQNTAYGASPQTARVPKHRRDGIDSREMIETADSSAIEIGFVDGSNLTIGADARVFIDEFTFDQASSQGQATITLSEGALRWKTGVMPAGGVHIETPTATITIRGTNVKVGVRANGDSLLGLDHGDVTIVPKGNGAKVDLKEGQGARVTSDGIDVLDRIPALADAVIDDGWGAPVRNGKKEDHGNR